MKSMISPQQGALLSGLVQGFFRQQAQSAQQQQMAQQRAQEMEDRKYQQMMMKLQVDAMKVKNERDARKEKMIEGLMARFGGQSQAQADPQMQPQPNVPSPSGQGIGPVSRSGTATFSPRFEAAPTPQQGAGLTDMIAAQQTGGGMTKPGQRLGFSPVEAAMLKGYTGVDVPGMQRADREEDELLLRQKQFAQEVSQDQKEYELKQKEILHKTNMDLKKLKLDTEKSIREGKDFDIKAAKDEVAKEEKVIQKEAFLKAQKAQHGFLKKQVNRAKKLAGWNTTGLVGAQSIKRIGPGTEAWELQEALKTIDANLGLDKLLDVKAKGGTFGALSEKELDLLVSSVASLNQFQDAETLKENLDIVLEHYQNFIQSLESDTRKSVESILAGKERTTGPSLKLNGRKAGKNVPIDTFMDGL
jgi:hypothetical protein